ncbi:SDR family NAD(P)-dependent oxidoreductase [Sulfitobacter donghicola]|uniref:Short-chain dehydrogenase n=1 Tax=Sulfitobacter donghicola DSW-25 = KCTC 12864 = JCM 14565 TaxID=1300350 RepID=A0A073IJ65_9RHOB|nr:SDR family NAD(P)-dependent oxidoreductase [Sulfitobacter donghicola]KEJ90368.1 short-chain dehydrogenase [Sulfitobacter donghicola DSW-25 = KCTC 12864 = JCM 14565]KIN67593.1 Oxidoreductase [Sulfitobacter donghicola DSW-25 = KCTC 12864 = JCM 14565]
MTQWQGKRYWLIGASDGIGAALAHQLSRAGAEVVLSARTASKLEDVANNLPGKSQFVPLDVTDTASVQKAAQEVGAVDGVIYLAGVYYPFSAKNWNAEQGEAMADVNFTGLMRVMGQVVPSMTDRDEGHIVITSSLAAYRGLRKSVGYAASKAATLSLAESMYADLRSTGVKVQVVNPGFVKTQMTEQNSFWMPQQMEPEDAAREIFEHMNTDKFKKSFPFGLSSLVRACQFLPDWVYYRLLG